MHNFKKSFGQNFLKYETDAKKFASYLNKDIADVVEVGPGDGKLTKQILDLGFNLTSVEVDTDLYQTLENKFNPTGKFKLERNDILEYRPDFKEYSLIGSLPYNISKQIILKFLIEENQPKEMILLIQKEVAHDYAAKVPNSTFLHNMVRIYGEVEYMSTIAKKNFFPEPKVDGGIIKIIIKNKKTEETENLAKFIRNGFMKPRKTLSNNLSSIYNLDKTELTNKLKELNIKELARPAEIEFENWKKLYEHFKTKQQNTN